MASFVIFLLGHLSGNLNLASNKCKLRSDFEIQQLKKAMDCEENEFQQNQTAIYSLLDRSEKEHLAALCETKLDALDATFNRRQQIRISNYPEDDRFYIDDKNTGSLYFDLYEPESICFSEERFGTEVRFKAFGDGPKFVCGISMIQAQESCLVYSVGSDNDFQFEQAVKNHMGCEIHTFDPTMKEMTFKGDAYSTFHPWGLGTDGDIVNFEQSKHTTKFVAMSFETIIKKLGHKGRKIDILKIDCEGCEFSAIPSLLESISKGELKVDQMLNEMHRHHDQRTRPKLPQFFGALDSAKMCIFHKERNHWGCGGDWCVEYAFASEEFLRRANPNVLCPEQNMTVE